jgi:DNA-binding NarL/FixJ family response regulator
LHDNGHSSSAETTPNGLLDSTGMPKLLSTIQNQALIVYSVPSAEENGAGPMLRIIVMDDEPQALKLYKSAFALRRDATPNEQNPNKKTQSIDPPYDADANSLDVVYCGSSMDTVNQVKQSIASEKPFAVAFLDIRMEGQEDGVWVAEQLRQMDPDLELVFVTGFSGYDPKEIVARVPPVHKMIYVQKPFGIHELLHLAYSLGHKWIHERSDRRLRESLHRLVNEKTSELTLANEVLEQRVQERTAHLEEANIALKVLLRQREEDKKKMGDTLLNNVRQLVKPMVEKLKITNISSRQHNILTTLESNLEEITNPFLKTLDAAYWKLTPMEIQVANLVKTGLSNKEMAELLGIAAGTIMIHRHNLRDKLGLKNKKVNLRSYLLSLE